MSGRPLALGQIAGSAAWPSGCARCRSSSTSATRANSAGNPSSTCKSRTDCSMPAPHTSTASKPITNRRLRNAAATIKNIIRMAPHCGTARTAARGNLGNEAVVAAAAAATSNTNNKYRRNIHTANSPGSSRSAFFPLFSATWPSLNALSSSLWSSSSAACSGPSGGQPQASRRPSDQNVEWNESSSNANATPNKARREHPWFAIAALKAKPSNCSPAAGAAMALIGTRTNTEAKSMNNLTPVSALATEIGAIQRNQHVGCWMKAAN
mmetsp:Transcript_19727/g.57414  ORF Transcript_19727/g.57414 Transcript_19727/m.57414 type:complete len:267 (-) Transcript_19727:226-1026(-)